MAGSDTPIPAPDSAPSNDWRRQHKRHRTNCLTCNMGDVVDLSPSGMRIDAQGRSAPKVGDVAKFTLHSPEGDLSVSGRTAWVRRKGLRKYELGIEFIDVRRAMAAALESLGRFGFLGTDRFVRHGHVERGSGQEGSTPPGRSESARSLQQNMDGIRPVRGPVEPHARDESTQAES